MITNNDISNKITSSGITIGGETVTSISTDVATAADGAMVAIGGQLRKKVGDTLVNVSNFNIDAVFAGSITEQVGTMTTAIDATLGTIQTLTMTADTTLTDSLIDGQSVTLILTNGSFTITYPTITWVGLAEPKLSTTDAIVFFKAGGVLYGSWNGATA